MIVHYKAFVAILLNIIIPIFSADDPRKAIVPDHTAAPWIHVAVRRQRFADTPPTHQAGFRLNNRLHASPSVDKFQCGDAQAMYQNAEQHQEVHDRSHGMQ